MFLDDAIELYLHRLKEGFLHEAILKELRDCNATLGSAVWAYAEVTGVTTDEAKHTVLLHPSWSNFAEATEALDTAFDAFLHRFGEPDEFGAIYISLEDLERLE
jgi:hypothetical protein